MFRPPFETKDDLTILPPPCFYVNWQSPMTRSCKGLQSQIHIILKFTFIEHEGFNCLARHGYNIKRNFGHGSQGLANLLATLNLFAFALHAVQDCVSDLWRQGRAQAGTRRNFFATLSFLTEWFCFCNWTALFETLLRQRPPPPAPRAAASAPA